MKEHALIYLGENAVYKQDIIHLLEEFDFLYTFLDDEDLNKQVSSLFHQENRASTNNQIFSFNFILFKDIDHSKILKFYKACKERGFPFSHKAVMTEHNQNWIMSELLEEIEEEHEFFALWENLNTLLKEANDSDPSQYTEASYDIYKKAFINAYIGCKQKTMNKETLVQLITDVKNARKALVKK